MKLFLGKNKQEKILTKSSKDLKKQVGVKIHKIIKMTLRQHMNLKENEGDHLNQNKKRKWNKNKNITTTDGTRRIKSTYHRNHSMAK